MRRVYLDNNATTPVLPAVFEAMQPYFGERFGNASSIHHHGQETRAAVERARESVAALLGCRSSEVVFTGGGQSCDRCKTHWLRSSFHLRTQDERSAGCGSAVRPQGNRSAPDALWREPRTFTAGGHRERPRYCRARQGR